MKFLDKMPVVSEKNRDIWREIETKAYSVYIMLCHARTVQFGSYQERCQERANAYGEMLAYQISQLLEQVTIQKAWDPFDECYATGIPSGEHQHFNIAELTPIKMWENIYIHSSMVGAFDPSNQPEQGDTFRIYMSNVGKVKLKQLIANADKIKMFSILGD